MRIATFNVNSVNARLPVLLRWLAESRPDVACLQELKAPQEKFPHDAIREAGYHALWHGQKGYNGVAVLARGEEPVETGRGLPGDPEDVQSRYLDPGERVYTFWEYLRGAWGRDAGLRIDHLLLNPAAARRLVAVGVDRAVRGWDKTSDHAPAWVELRDA